MSNLCPHCSTEFQANASFCSNCGKALAVAEPTVAPRKAAEPKAAGDTPPADETMDFDRSGDALPGVDTTSPAESVAGAPVVGRRIEAGQLIGQYRTLHPLGEGGMGVVWAAEDEVTGRRVALKVMSPSLTGNAATVERFVREGQLAAKLSHPRSTFVFDAGEQDGCPYIAMELMPGRTLDDLVKEEGQLSVQRAVDLIMDVIDGLEAAHAMGIIHRDVKPSNCFLDGEGRAKVGDYGLSKSLVADASLTRTGAFMGTPLYAAPEQVRGADVDERTDVYAVGATLFYLLAGQGPFDGDAMAVIAKIVSDPPSSLRSLRRDAPASLERVIARALDKDPTKRFATLGQLRSALLPFASGGTSMAALGRRVAAYMLDSMTASLLAFIALSHLQLIQMISLYSQGAIEPFRATQQSGVQAAMFITTQVILIAYFTIGEGRWGCCFGKWAMGLRVTTLDGEAPGFGRALRRVFFIPCALGFNVVWPLIAVIYFSDRGQESQQMTISMVGGLVNWLFIVSFLVTMRARNGYRAVHDFASGTRVVRWKTGEAEIRLPTPVLLPVAEKAKQYGPYTVLGAIGQDDSGGAILLGNDQSLHRQVWLRVVDGPLDANRAATQARPTRPYFLQGGEWEGGAWEAYEAISGAPLAWIARRPELIEWSVGKKMLLDLATELLAVCEERGAQAKVSMDQIWVDRQGRLRFLESPLHLAAARDPFKRAEADSNPKQLNPVDLLRHCAALVSGGKTLPTPARDFLNELATRNDDETLEWAEEELAELAPQRDKLHWDDRLTMLGASMATEFTIYIALSVGLSLILTVLPVSQLLQATTSISVLLLVAFCVGAFFRGSPVFWLTGVELLDRKGRLAGPIRSGLRSVVVWFGVILFYGFTAMALKTMMKSGGDPREFTEAASELLVPLLGGECLFGLFIIGGLYTLLRPQRGIQDHIVGTQLMPLR